MSNAPTVEAFEPLPQGEAFEGLSPENRRFPPSRLRRNGGPAQHGSMNDEVHHVPADPRLHDDAGSPGRCLRKPVAGGPQVRPVPRVRRQRGGHRRGLRRGRRRPARLLGEAGPRAADLEQGLHPGPGLVHAALRQVVRRRRDQRRLQRAGPPRRGRPRGPGRHLLRGRTRRYPHLHVRPAHRGGQEGRQRLRVPRRRQGRPRGRVPADDSRGRHHAAGLRPDRRHPLGGLRRLLRRGAALPDRRRRSQARRHRRRHLPARQAQRAQARRRRGAVPRGRRQRPHRAERRRRQAQRPGRRLARGPRPLVGGHGRDRLRRAHRRRA